MASIIRIKRSSVSGNPSTLGAGELAYSALTDNGSNGGDRLYIGIGTETAGNAANHFVIGGKYFTDMLDQTPGILTASSALVVDSSKKLDELLVDNLSLNGNTVSSSSGNIVLSSAGTMIQLASSNYIAGGAYDGSQLILDSGIASIKQLRGGDVSLIVGASGSATSTLTFNNDGSLTVPGTIKTLSNGDLTLSPNGTGKLVLNNPYINGTTNTLAEYIYDTVGGAITAGTGISVTNSDAGNTSTISLASGVATAGTYGSSSAIPSITIDTYGRVTSISTNSISSSFTLGSTSISLGGTTTAIAGMASVGFAGSTSGSITVQATAIAGTNTLTLPAATDTLVGKATTDTLTNKTISGSSNTLTNIGNSSLTNSSVTIGSTSVSLGATATTLAGLTSVTSTTFVGALTGNASTATTLQTARTINGTSFNGSADITITAAAGTLTGTTLNSTVVSSSLTSVGTIGTGVWQGTTVAVGYGGTGTTTGSITGTGALTFTSAAGNNNVNLVPTGTGIVDVGGKRVGNAADPTQSTDLATKAYVDGLSNGLDVKQSVVAASTTALTVTYSNGSSGVGATLTNAGTQAALTLDGIALSAGDRVLIKDQASGLQNGVYTVTTVGTISTNWVLTRATDFDNSPNTEVSPGTFFFVEQGNTQADNGYVISTDTAITIGTTAIVFSQFSGAGQITAGAGLTKSGNTIDVVGTLNRISVATDSIDISASYVGQTSITTLGTIGTGTWQGTLIGSTYGGTGVNNGSSTLTMAGSVTHAGSFTQSFTATGNTAVTLPTTGTLATLAGTETFTNKTLTSPTINTATIAGGTHTGITGLGIRDTSAAYDVTIAAVSSTALTAGRTVTLDVVNAARSIKLAGNIDLAGNLTTAGAFTTSGAYGITLTATASTSVTLPTTGTLATLAGSESLSNKTITSSSFAGSVAASTLSASGAVTFTSTTDASALGTAAVVMSGGLSVAKAMYVGTNITGAGAGTSTLDGFQIDGGTY